MNTPTIAIEIEAAKRVGRYETYKSVAVAESETHVIVPRKAWMAVRAGRRPPRLPRTTPPAVKGPGDHLHDVIAERLGRRPKGACRCQEMVRRMNASGVKGCRERHAEIVAHLMQQRRSLPRAYRVMMRLPGGRLLARRQAQRMVDEAMRRAVTGG